MLTENPATKIRILGVNSASPSSVTANPLMVAGRDLPWLQDDTTQLVWNAWAAEIDDVFIVDANNRLVEVYSALRNDLADVDNYNELKAKLKTAAGE